MSLEAAITENTNAIRDLIAAIKAGVPTTAAQVAAVVTEAQAETAKAGKEEAAAKKTTAAATEAAARTQSTAEAGADAAQEKKADNSEASDKPAPTYQDAAAAINKIAKAKGRDAAVAVLAKFGAGNLKEVKPENFADIIAAVEAEA